MAFVDDLHGVLLVFGLAGEGKSVLGLSVGNLVDPEPLIRGADKTRKVPLDILDIVQLGGQGVLDIDDDDLPIGLSFVKESHDAEDLDLLDLTNVSDLLADLADIEGIVVTLGFGLGVHLRRVFPSLGEGTVVPDVAMVGEAVPHVAQLSSLDVLLDGIERLLLGDLHLRVGPSRNLHNHVEDALVLVSEEGDVMERRDDRAILLDEDAMF